MSNVPFLSERKDVLRSLSLQTQPAFLGPDPKGSLAAVAKTPLTDLEESPCVELRGGESRLQLLSRLSAALPADGDHFVDPTNFVIKGTTRRVEFEIRVSSRGATHIATFVRVSGSQDAFRSFYEHVAALLGQAEPNTAALSAGSRPEDNQPSLLDRPTLHILLDMMASKCVDVRLEAFTALSALCALSPNQQLVARDVHRILPTLLWACESEMKRARRTGLALVVSLSNESTFCAAAESLLPALFRLLGAGERDDQQQAALALALIALQSNTLRAHLSSAYLDILGDILLSSPTSACDPLQQSVQTILDVLCT